MFFCWVREATDVRFKALQIFVSCKLCYMYGIYVFLYQACYCLSGTVVCFVSCQTSVFSHLFHEFCKFLQADFYTKYLLLDYWPSEDKMGIQEYKLEVDEGYSIS